MKKKEIRSWMEKIEERKMAVEAERNKIDSLIAELEGLAEVCDKAADSLQDARDALSALV
jgi:DNA repair ATPase RecN